MASKKHRKDTGSKSSVILRRDLEISHQSIAARAYGIWLQQERPIGQDVPNWFQAEQELRQAVLTDGDVEQNTE